MGHEVTEKFTPPEGVAGRSEPRNLRGHLREVELQSALRKRAAGVPTYTVAEAAALLSVSKEYLYRIVQADGFPAVHMLIGRGGRGRYLVPAKAVEAILDHAAGASSCVDASQWTASWSPATSGGAA